MCARLALLSQRSFNLSVTPTASMFTSSENPSDGQTRKGGFSAAMHWTVVHESRPPKWLYLRVTLWNGFPGRVTVETIEIRARRGRFQGLGEVQTNVRRKRYRTSEVKFPRVALPSEARTTTGCVQYPDLMYTLQFSRFQSTWRPARSQFCELVFCHDLWLIRMLLLPPMRLRSRQNDS